MDNNITESIPSDTTSERLAVSPSAVSLADIPKIVRSYIRWFIAVVLLATVAAIVFVSSSTPIYTAHVYLAPGESSNEGVQLGGQFQQVADMFGVSGGAGSVPVSEFTAAMQSQHIAERLFNDKTIREHLFPDQWDSTTESWTRPMGIKAALRRFFYKTVLRMDLPAPGPDMVVQHVAKNLLISNSKDNPGLIEVSYEGKNPDFALYFLTALVDSTEGALLKQYRQRNDASLSYARGVLEKEGLQPVREALQSIIVTELRRSVILGANRLDTVRIVLPPEVDRIPRRPSLVVSLLMFNLIAVLGLLAVLLFKRGMSQELHH